jgi:hypothetical protein
MRRVDYDSGQHQDYARGRALNGRQMKVWMEAFPAVLSEHRPLAGLLVVATGASTGTPAEKVERLHLRKLSFFAQLNPDEPELGFHRPEQTVAADPDAPAPVFAEPLLTLELS